MAPRGVGANQNTIFSNIARTFQYILDRKQ